MIRIFLHIWNDFITPFSISLRVGQVRHTYKMSSDSEDEGFLDFLDIGKKLRDGQYYEELKWLRNCLQKALDSRNSSQDYEIDNESMTMPNESIQKAINDDTFKRLLNCLDLIGPKGGKSEWKIPGRFDRKRLKAKLNIVNDFIFDQLERCKGCQNRFKSIRKHLIMNDTCQSAYSKGDQDELFEMSKVKAKRTSQKWQRENKESISEKNAQRYQVI